MTGKGLDNTREGRKLTRRLQVEDLRGPVIAIERTGIGQRDDREMSRVAINSQLEVPMGFL